MEGKKKLFKYKYWVLKSIIESWQAITVMVWLLYYLDLIMHSASFVCLVSYAHTESDQEKKFFDSYKTCFFHVFTFFKVEFKGARDSKMPNS